MVLNEIVIIGEIFCLHNQYNAILFGNINLGKYCGFVEPVSACGDLPVLCCKGLASATRHIDYLDARVSLLRECVRRAYLLFRAD